MTLGVIFSDPNEWIRRSSSFVLQNIEQSEWQNYHYFVVNSENEIRNIIRSNQPKRFHLWALLKSAIALPGLDYFSDDVTAAWKRKPYLDSYQGTPERAEAVKTLNFFGDWLLNQPEIMVAQGIYPFK